MSRVSHRLCCGCGQLRSPMQGREGDRKQCSRRSIDSAPDLNRTKLLMFPVSRVLQTQETTRAEKLLSCVCGLLWPSIDCIKHDSEGVCRFKCPRPRCANPFLASTHSHLRSRPTATMGFAETTRLPSATLCCVVCALMPAIMGRVSAPTSILGFREHFLCVKFTSLPAKRRWRFPHGTLIITWCLPRYLGTQVSISFLR